MPKPLAEVLEATPRTPGDLMAAQIRRYRERRGWSQRDLCRVFADRFGVTVNPATLARLETGQRRITVDEAAMFAVALDVPLVMLFWPLDEVEPVSVAPGVQVHAWRAVEWAVGNDPLPGADDEAWNSATALFVHFADVLDAAYYASFRRHQNPAEYRKALQRLASTLLAAKEVGFIPIEGMVPIEVLTDLKKEVERAPMRQRTMRPRRGEES